MSIRTRMLFPAWFLLVLMVPLQGQNPPPVARVGDDGVFVRVLVTDPLNRYITGLEKEHFTVFEDNVRQTINFFAQQSAPLTLGVVFNQVGSMRGGLAAARQTLDGLAKSQRSADAYFMISVDGKASKVENFGSNPVARTDFVIDEYNLRTPMEQVVAFAIGQIRNQNNEKKALVIITDGQVSSTMPDIQVYSIRGRYSRPADDSKEVVRTFFPTSSADLDHYLTLIQDELLNQYILGYSPTNREQDGKWRKIKVKLDPPKGLPKLTVNASDGYTAPGK